MQNDQWDPATDPSRRQLVDKYTFKFDGDPQVSGETVLSDQGATTVVTALQSSEYHKAQSRRPAGPGPGRPAALHRLHHARTTTKIKELEVRQALAYAYAYEDIWAAAGEIVGVTLANGVTDPDLGFGLLPPGMAGRQAWNGPDGDERSSTTRRSPRSC